MERAMSAVEMTGTVDEHHQLRLDGELPISGPVPVRVLVLCPSDGEPGEEEWLQAAARNPAFAFLDEPEEDLYSLDDGEPFHDQG